MVEQIISFEKHILIHSDDKTAITVLSENSPQISKQKLKQAMQYGAVWLTQSGKTNRLRRAKKVLSVGDELHLYFNSDVLSGDIQPATLIADEGEFSVWNKPCGMFSQGTKWGDHSAICRWVELRGFELNSLPKRSTFLVHRLDRATSGLIVVAHTKKMTRKLSALFESRQIEKHYHAVVSGNFKAISEGEKIEQEIDGRFASTHLLKSKYNSATNQTELLLKLETGRKHQIRKHLSGLGFPIIGDRLYGGKKEGADIDLQLRSCFLEFTSPISSLLCSYQIAYNI